MENLEDATLNFLNNKLFLSGKLHFANVMSIYHKGLTYLQKQTSVQLEIDCSQLSSSDSSGLALILEWVKWGRAHQQTIVFKEVPEDLMMIAKAARVEQFIEKVLK